MFYSISRTQGVTPTVHGLLTKFFKHMLFVSLND
uniref:Uncharacterized protein n=1 Tax=Anguilla anguilla TaxID=7936 RepID=A0A0E9R4Y7_ANGAN